MADAFTVRATSFIEAQTGQTSTVFVPAAGLTDNDLMLVYLNTSSGTAPTAPAGWTRILNAGSSGAGFSYIYYKVAASEAGSYTFTHASITRRVSGITTLIPASWLGSITVGYTMPVSVTATHMDDTSAAADVITNDLAAGGVIDDFFTPIFQTASVTLGGTPPSVAVALDSDLTAFGNEDTNFGANAWSSLHVAGDNVLDAVIPALTDTLTVTNRDGGTTEGGLFRVLISIISQEPVSINPNDNRYTKRRFSDIALPYDLRTIKLGG